MVFIILLIGCCFANDYVVTEGFGVTEIQCVDKLCSLCSTDSIFQVVNTTDFLVPGYLYSTSVLMQTQVKELLLYMNGTINVAIGEKYMCIEFIEITQPPSLPLFYNSLLGLNLQKNHSFIEAFTVGPINIVATRSERAGSGSV